MAFLLELLIYISFTDVLILKDNLKFLRYKILSNFLFLYKFNFLYVNLKSLISKNDILFILIYSFKYCKSLYNTYIIYLYNTIKYSKIKFNKLLNLFVINLV